MVQADVNSLDAYVGVDGSLTLLDPTQAAYSPEPPAALLDLALGLLAGRSDNVEFVWTGDPAAPYWLVRLQRVRMGTRDVARLRARRAGELPFRLTQRELEVATLLGAGMANPAIGEALGISTRTTTTHVDRVLRKMGVANRSEAGAVAHDRGLFAVPLPAPAAELTMLRVARLVVSAARPTPLRGTSALGPAAPVIIGALVPVTGRAQADGVEMAQGAELAVAEINARGGINGRQLRLEIEDVDVNSRGDITAAVHQLMRKGASAITTGYLAHQQHAVELAAADGIPFLHASACSAIDDLVASDSERYRGVFQVCPNDRNYAPNFVKFMSNLRDSGAWTPKSQQLVVAAQSNWDNVDFGLGEAARLAAAAGWDLVPLAVKDRELSEVAWAEAGTSIADAAAVMLGSFFVEDQVSFMQSFLGNPEQALVYSIYAPSIPAFRQQLEAGADGMVWATTTGSYSDSVAHEFVASFQARFGRTPGRSMAGIAYDRVHILSQSWAQTDDVNNFDAVAQRLARTRYRGVNGSYVFHESGHGTHALGSQTDDPSLGQAHTVFQIQHGRNVLIGPTLYSTGKFDTPRWAAG